MAGIVERLLPPIQLAARNEEAKLTEWEPWMKQLSHSFCWRWQVEHRC